MKLNVVGFIAKKNAGQCQGSAQQKKKEEELILFKICLMDSDDIYY